MDNITSTSLYSLSVCDLNTNFNDKCHLDWSKSNLISIVTLDGIYILKPQLDVQHGPFKIDLIRNPATRFKHEIQDHLWPKFDKMWQNLNSQNYMEVYLDPALMTNIENLSLELYPRRYRLARWSPLIKIYPMQCLLATLTLDFQLLVFARRHDTWVILSDMSADYDRIWSQFYKSKDVNKKTTDNYEEIRKDLHSLSFCNVCWKESQHDGPILLAATITGDIVVWKFSLPVEEQVELQLEVVTILRTSLEYINSMNLYKNLLILSARDGQVVLYDLTIYFNELESSTKLTNEIAEENTPIKTLNLIILQPTATLWHKDYIEVNDLYLQSIGKDTFRIVLAKSTNICWCIINYTKKTNDEFATLAISDSFSAIDGSDPDVSLHQTPATCLKPAGERKAVLIADDGSFFQLEFIDGRQETSPEFSAIRTGKVDLSRMVPRGLCTSPQGNLIAMISCISLIYEPSKILAPSKLILLPITNDRRFFIDCFDKLLNEDWLRSESITSLMDVCDRLDYIQSIYPSLIPQDSLELSRILKDAIVEIGMPKNQAQLIKLKIISFLMLKLIGHKERSMIESDPSLDVCKQAWEKILLYHIIEVVGRVKLTGKTDISSMKTHEIISLRNYSNWLDMSTERKEFKERFIEQFKAIDTFVTFQETCPICKTDIPFVDADYGTCKEQHRYDRCARSLLIVSPQSDTKLTCELCDRCYVGDNIRPEGNLWLCLYCQ